MKTANNQISFKGDIYINLPSVEKLGRPYVNIVQSTVPQLREHTDGIDIFVRKKENIRYKKSSIASHSLLLTGFAENTNKTLISLTTNPQKFMEKINFMCLPEELLYESDFYKLWNLKDTVAHVVENITPENLIVAVKDIKSRLHK